MDDIANSVETSPPAVSPPANFVNPNFRFVREDELNCNTTEQNDIDEEDDKDEMEVVASPGGEGDDYYQDAHIYEDISTGTFTRRASSKSRAAYHRIDASSMGVDVEADPSTNLPQSSSPTHNSTIDHVKGPLNEDIYAVVSKRDDDEEVEQERPLPSGWQKHEDEDGPYYWHVKTGTIQREPPTPDIPLSASRDMLRQMVSAATSPMSPSTSDYALQHFHSGFHSSGMTSPSSSSLKPSTSTSHSSSFSSSKPSSLLKLPTKFAVRSLGWVEIGEDDLTPERSSRAVNRCIVDLSLGRRDLLDNVGRWGDGKDLYLELDLSNLKLLNPQDMAVLHLQSIHSIRVWGVGRDNNRSHLT